MPETFLFPVGLTQQEGKPLKPEVAWSLFPLFACWLGTMVPPGL